MENPWLLAKFAWPRHSSGLAPRSIGVRFHSFNRVRDWDPKGSSRRNPTWNRSPEQFSGLNLSPGHPPLSLNMVFLNPRDWWKTPDFCQNSPDQGTPRVWRLAPSEWSSIPTIACGIEIRKVLLVATRPGIGHQSNFLGSTFHRVTPPRFPLIWYF